MIRRQLLIAFAMTTIAALGTCECAIAQDYVWTRTPWGSSNINGHYSSMTNGYGGYYVPRNGYGNNYESRGNFSNPTGYIVPGGQQPAYAAQGRGHRRRHWR